MGLQAFTSGSSLSKPEQQHKLSLPLLKPVTTSYNARMNLVKTPNGDILRVVTQEEVTHRCGKVTSTLILQNVKFEVTVVAQAPISDVLKSFNMESA